MFQILWERGWIEINKLDLYSEKGRTSQLDCDGNIKKEFESYVLRTLISNCQDVTGEKSAMEVLLDDLSHKGTPNEELAVGPVVIPQLIK